MSATIFVLHARPLHRIFQERLRNGLVPIEFTGAEECLSGGSIVAQSQQHGRMRLPKVGISRL